MRFKKPALAFAIGLGVLLVSIAFLPAALDRDALRERLVRGLSTAIGSEISIEGPLEIGFGLEPDVAFGPALLASGWAHAGDPIGRAERVELEVRLWRLLFGAVDIREIRVRGGRVDLVRDVEGRPNWDFGAAAEGSGAAGSSSSAEAQGIAFLSVQIEELVFEDLRIRYRDPTAEIDTTAVFERLALGPALGDGGTRLEVRGAIDEIPVVLTGRAERRGAAEAGGTLPLFRVALGGTLEGLDVTAQGVIGGGRGVDVQLSVDAPELTLLRRRFGAEFPPLGPVHATAHLISSGNVLGIRGLDVRVGSREGTWVTVRGDLRDVFETRGVDIEVEFGTDEIGTLTPWAGSQSPAPHRVVGRARLIDADGTLGIEEFTVDAGEEGGVEIRISGQLDHLRELDEIDVGVELEAPNLAALGAVEGLDLPAGGPVEATLRIVGSDERADFRALEATIGATRITGTVFASFVPGQRLRLEADLRSPRVRLEDLGLTPEDADPTQPAPAPGERVFGDAPLPYSLLDTFDAQISVSLDEVVGQNDLRLGRVSAKASLEAGVLRLDPVALVWEQGAVHGSARVDAREDPPMVSLELKAEHIQLGRLLAQFVPDPGITGVAEAEIRLTGSGATPRALAASAKGSLSVTIRDGTARLGAMNLSATDSVGGWLRGQSGTNDLALRCAVGRLRVEAGIAHVETLFLRLKNLLVVGRGVIDLRQETLDGRLLPKPWDANPLHVAVPVRVRGPLRNLRVSPDALNLGAGTLQSTFNRLLSGTKQGLLKGLGSKSARDPCRDPRLIGGKRW